MARHRRDTENMDLYTIKAINEDNDTHVNDKDDKLRLRIVKLRTK
ncbi:MAG: hypothetical protein WAK17_15850 [Candidatus Nitrosopolaris sp.]|jgi:hypothetical protein